MLEIENIDSFRRSLSGLRVKVKADKKVYTSKLYEHLFSLLKFDLLYGNGVDHSFSSFHLSDYYGLTQYAIDNSAKVEPTTPREIDWKFIDDAKEVVRSHFQELLGPGRRFESRIKPMLDFTIEAIENEFIYQMMHPVSDANPWLACEEIFRKGYLFYGLDNLDEIQDYNPGLARSIPQEYHSNLGFIALSETESNHREAFTGFVVDNRLTLQHVVYSYLRQNANGWAHPKRKKDIEQHIEANNLNPYRLPIILQNLKRVGVVGSINKGYFCLNSREDFEATISSHYRLKNGVEATIKAMTDRASSLGFEFEEDRFTFQVKAGF